MICGNSIRIRRSSQKYSVSKIGRLPLHQVAEAVFNVGKSILLYFWYHLCLMVLLYHILQRDGSFDEIRGSLAIYHFYVIAGCI